MPRHGRFDINLWFLYEIKASDVCIHNLFPELHPPLPPTAKTSYDNQILICIQSCQIPGMLFSLFIYPDDLCKFSGSCLSHVSLGLLYYLFAILCVLNNSSRAADCLLLHCCGTESILQSAAQSLPWKPRIHCSLLRAFGNDCHRSSCTFFHPPLYNVQSARVTKRLLSDRPLLVLAPEEAGVENKDGLQISYWGVSV